MDTYGPAALRWMAVGVVFGGAALYYYSGDGKKRRAIRPTRQNLTDTAAKESVDSDTASAKGKPKKQKVMSKPKTKLDEKPTETAALMYTGAADDNDVDNKAFAKLMTDARKGTSYQGKAAEKRIKTVKQSKSEDSNASSTTGADADDDLSPALSPTFASNNVADMLEPAKPGPSVLSIKPSSQPSPAKKPHQPKAEPDVETKKQRQNRLKNEEKKAVREEAEKARRAAEEKQRRTAREARGEPAKNGIPIAPAPANSWNTSKINGTAVAPPVASVGALLDTFEEEPTPTRKSVTNTVSAPADKSYFPSEEEQEAWAQEDTPWSTVESKKGKKKKTNTGVTDSEGSGVDTAKPESKAAPVVTKSTTNGVNTNRYAASSGSFTPSMADSDWAA